MYNKLLLESLKSVAKRDNIALIDLINLEIKEHQHPRCKDPDAKRTIAQLLKVKKAYNTGKIKVA